MAMTLRTTPELDSAISRLALRWGVSKTEAILRAVQEADESRSLEDDAMAAYARVSSEYREALDRLGSV
ncbi:CopG family transcriptional regulator [Demequina subtropica]|uniref:CopG family transcriptional regulator n=1 Tax=Demequina subtropica TaxID=1638989 RepID=UPI000A41ED2C|nr:CopG family transcriptional regulator [Demequina subtropica]